MHTEMWQHPATADNVATLRRRGAVVLEPASGRLTGADSGAGRLPEAERQAWQKLWADVADMLARADGTSPAEQRVGGKTLLPDQ